MKTTKKEFLKYLTNKYIRYKLKGNRIIISEDNFSCDLYLNKRYKNITFKPFYFHIKINTKEIPEGLIFENKGSVVISAKEIPANTVFRNKIHVYLWRTERIHPTVIFDQI